MEALDRLLNFYEPPDVADPKTFIAGIGALLALYPDELIVFAIDPARGIPAHVKRLNNLAALKEVLDDLYAPIQRRIEREAIANAPRALPAPPRTPEEQAKVAAQVAAVRKRLGLPERMLGRATAHAVDRDHARRVAAELAQRKAPSEDKQA